MADIEAKLSLVLNSKEITIETCMYEIWNTELYPQQLCLQYLLEKLWLLFILFYSTGKLLKQSEDDYTLD